jgi:hypothetical protein
MGIFGTRSRFLGDECLNELMSHGSQTWRREPVSEGQKTQHLCLTTGLAVASSALGADDYGNSSADDTLLSDRNLAQASNRNFGRHFEERS